MMRALSRFAVGLMVPLMILLPLPAIGHPAVEYFPVRWQTSRTQHWGFIQGFPQGERRDRVFDGAHQWNLQNQSLTFLNTFEKAPFDPLNPCVRQYGDNAIHWRPVDGIDGVLAYVSSCLVGEGEIINAQLNFDPDEDWYTGTGDAGDGAFGLCIPRCQTDFWSVSTHEWGHMAGFDGPFNNGHFDGNDDSLCDDNAAQHTMCPFYSPGSERQRDLAEHDWHTFREAY